MMRPIHLYAFLFLLAGALNLANAQILTCVASAVPPVVRGEGIAERAGDMVLNCSGGMAGAKITGNLSVFLSVNITNRVTAANVVTDAILTVDNGSGPQVLNVSGTVTGPNTLVYNGVSFTLSATGAASLRLANVRVAANQLMLIPNASVLAYLAFNAGSLVSVTNIQFPVATPVLGLYAGFASKLVCGPKTSPLPDNPGSFASLLSAGTVFASTRLTEGFGDAFTPRGVWQSLNADTGARIIVRYTGFPDRARLFVPDVITGSDATVPTSGGDLNLPASGGKYTPGGNGSLLLVRVQYANSNGVGGTPVYFAGAPGSGVVSFDSMTEVGLANGSGFVVYEVMDANPSVQESAQFPTFLGFVSFGGDPVITSEDVSLAPVSTVNIATPGDPIPRFQRVPVPFDCNIIGDCGAFYYPQLAVDKTRLDFTGQAGSNFQIAYVTIKNNGGGAMNWVATANYTNGSGWVHLSPTDGINNATLRVDVFPGGLTPGTYKAIVTVNAGPFAGSKDIAVTLVVTPPPPEVARPVVNQAVNGASFAAGPLAPGSIASLFGIRLSGSNVSVTFDGLPAQVLFNTDTQINVIVPDGLASKTSAQVMVTASGISSVPQTVALASFAPGIFANGVLNEDYSLNGASHPAPSGTVIQIFATGLSGNGVITAKLTDKNGDRSINQPYYGGPAPGLTGVQQVDLVLPPDLVGSPVYVAVCGGPAVDQVMCSAPVPVVVEQ